jgi:hypothetical protein
MLRSVLAAPIRVTPFVGGGRRGFRFEGQRAFDRVIGGAGISASRDGQFSLQLIREFRVSSSPDAQTCRAPPGLGREHSGWLNKNPRADDAMPEPDESVKAPIYRTRFSWTSHELVVG